MFRKKDLVDYIAPLVLGASIFAAPLSYINAQDKKPETTASIDDLTQAEVDNLMKRESVDDILKEEYDSGRIQKVTYDSAAKKTNFKKLVYQEDSLPKDKKPVLMLVADGDGLGGLIKEKYTADKGDAIVVKNLANKYQQFIVVFYDPSIVPDFVEVGRGKVKFGQELKNENLTTRPSIVVYDNTSIKQSYLFKGGPVEPGANTSVFEVRDAVEKEIKKFKL